MRSDIILKIEGVKGESRDQTYQGEIDIQSWSWGMTNNGTAHLGEGNGGGVVSVQDIHFTKIIDKSSAKLMQHCCTGKHFPKATLIQRRAGGDKPLEFLKIEFEQVLVSSYQTGSHGDSPTDSFSFNFAKFKATYTVQNADGTKGAPDEAGYDIARKVPC